MLHYRDDFGQVMSGAWFPPEMTLGIQAKVFILCLRPQDFISHGLWVESFRCLLVKSTQGVFFIESSLQYKPGRDLVVPKFFHLMMEDGGHCAYWVLQCHRNFSVPFLALTGVFNVQSHVQSTEHPTDGLQSSCRKIWQNVEIGCMWPLFVCVMANTVNTYVLYVNV